MIYTPYTYLIGWSSLNKWYYGVRTAAGCNPSDLFKTYFTSSKHVHAVIAEHGLPDVIQVRRTFVTSYDARRWEAVAIRRVGINNDKWLNQHSPDEGFFIKGPVSEETKNRMRAAALALPQIQCEHCGKIVNPGHYAQFHGDRCRSTGFKGSRAAPTEATRAKLSAASKGRVMDDETRAKLSAVIREQHKLNPREKLICEHCGTTCTKTNYIRWHGDKCKKRTV